jgi:Tfp pilus assembly protein PilF
VTGRQATLLRYSVAALAMTLLIIAAVTLVEWERNGDDDSGIVDVLARGLPENAPINRFTDVTARAGITMRHFPADRTRMLPEDMGSGLAWGDCDGDGFDDLYVVNFAAPVGTDAATLATLPGNALYHNRGDGTFEEVSAAAGVGVAAFGMGAAWGDYDGDGDSDLYVTNYGRNVLYRNEGACSFSDATAAAGVGGDDYSAGAVWGDYDGDGDLDLYVADYVVFDEGRKPQGTPAMQYGKVVPFTLNPASYDPAANHLYRNDGGGRFSDVARDAGVANEAGRSLSAAWADWDADGDLDLYVANDISDNAFFLNRGDGTFEDVSTATLTADYRGAMGLAVGDYDGDADLDFFVTHWIAQENALYENHRSADAASVPDEPLLFTDVADLVGLGAPGLDYVGWGTGFIDFDNDGRKDLFVVNGHTLEDDADVSRLLPQHMQLFWNRGDEGFFELSEVAGPPFERLLVARGAATSDYDGDGDVDIAVLAHGAGVVLMNNGGSPGAHWIELDLRQEGDNRRAVGATIRLDTTQGSQLVPVGGAASYLSQDSLTAHFGLAGQQSIGRVVVRWPDRTEEAFPGLAVDQRHTLARGAGADPAVVPTAAGGEADFWAAYRAGTEARRRGHTQAAIDAYERALTIQPAHPDTLHNLAQLRYARGELDIARTLLQRLAAADPRVNRAWQQLSTVAGTPVAGWTIDLAVADEMADRALEVHPNNSESHLLKARWAAYRGDSAAAQAELEAALGLNPRGAESYVLAIWLAVEAGNDAAAESRREQAVAAMCGEEALDRACLGDALYALLSAYWTEEGTPRRHRSNAAGRPVEAVPAPPLRALVDLDGDGNADLRVLAHAPAQPARLVAVGDGDEGMPAAAGRAWSGKEEAGASQGAARQRAMPWRGVFLDDVHGPGLVLVGGGARAVRVYVPAGDLWSERPMAGLPGETSGAVLAAADWDGDGADDLFLANVLEAGAEGDSMPGAGEGGFAGRIYWRRGASRFEADARSIAGPLAAALALDADGDGDADLALARALPARETAVTRSLQSAEAAGAAGPAEPPTILTLWRNDGGVLHEDADAMPSLRAPVQDLAVVAAGALPGIWVATGGLSPERIEGDLLLANRGGRFVDDSAALADALRFDTTVRAWPLPSGGLLLLRGGTVPADPPRFVDVPPARLGRR